MAGCNYEGLERDGIGSILGTISPMFSARFVLPELYLALFHDFFFEGGVISFRSRYLVFLLLNKCM